jgi:hypothetical protein
MPSTGISVLMVSAPLTSTQLASLLEPAPFHMGHRREKRRRSQLPDLRTYLVGPSLIVGANRIPTPRWGTSNRIAQNRC